MVNRKQLHSLYLMVFIVWLLLISIVVALLVKSDIDTQRDYFNVQARNLYYLLNERVKVNETVVEGYAATVSAVGFRDWKEIREYAQQMKHRYPHIFMFEIVEKVLKKDKDKFEDFFRKNVFKSFEIRAFHYDTDRQWKDVQNKEIYMPIVFMEPFPPESKKVLGLDISSNRFLLSSLQHAIESHSSVATRPFNLVEGDRGYLLYKPIIKYTDNKAEHDHSHHVENRYALLVILAKSLFKNKLEMMADYGIRLYHSEFADDDSQGVLYQQAGAKVSALEALLFPRLVYEKKLNNDSQPFVLHLSRQLGWSVLSVWLLLSILIVGVISFFVMIHYARIYHQLKLMRQQETENLFYLANHDGLTGLANRNLLLDRLRHALKQAERSGARLAVLFMDLNDFKSINDKYGHDAGDQLLQSASERMLACIRIGDTLSRRSGDEFVLVLENIQSKEKIDAVVKKIKAAFDNDFFINDTQIKVGISVGVAIYPDDVKTEYELLELADERMYQDKKSASK